MLTGCKQGENQENQITLNDQTGRQISIHSASNKVICSGPGCLRLLTYLKAQHKIVAVDSIEKRTIKPEVRPYTLANPQFKQYPLFGEFRGFDQPELILNLKETPQVIFKTYAEMGYNYQELQQKTGIPVIVLKYGDLHHKKDDLYTALRLMAKVVDQEKRAEEVISFFNHHIQNIQSRLNKIPENQRKSAYIGAVAFKGVQGLRSTEPNYLPFKLLNIINVAHNPQSPYQRHSQISSEKLLEWDPDFILIDLSTLQLPQKANGIYELKNASEYKFLKAVKTHTVYGVLPYNWYTTNYSSILINAYYIGKLIYPEQFQDIKIQQKADEIYQFLFDKPLYEIIKKPFENHLFKQCI